MAAPITPKGAKSDKIWRDAIMRSVRRLETDKAAKKGRPEQRLERLADALVGKGMKADVSALREIGDRLDGKAVQGLTLNDKDGGPVQFTQIERVIVDPNSKD